MRPSRLATPLAVSVLSLLAGPALAVDVLVWTEGSTGARTTWLEVADGKATSVATREGRVQSDGKDVWVLEQRKVPITLLACEDLEGGDDAPPPAEDGEKATFDWPTLSARSLLTGTSTSILGSADADPFYGEVWSEQVDVTGGAGGLVMVNHIHTGYGCGAHGYDDSGMFVYDLAAAESVAPDSLIVQYERFKKAPVKELAQKARKEECVDNEDTLEEVIFLDGLSLDAHSGAVGGSATFIHPTGAEWNFACTLDQDKALDEADLAPRLRPSASVKQALKTLSVTGTVGYSELSLGPELRAKALAAFMALPERVAPAPTRARPDAAPHIERGRKLTAAKKYEEAVTAFDAAIRKDPEAARAWSGRGYARLMAGQLELAARDFDHALTLDASADYRAAVFYNLGQVAEKQGQLQQARRAYAKSLEERPSKAVQKALDAVTAKLKK